MKRMKILRETKIEYEERETSNEVKETLIEEITRINGDDMQKLEIVKYWFDKLIDEKQEMKKLTKLEINL